MCGIVGYVGVRDAAPLLLLGLERLEYRGYDSAGLAVHDAASGRIAVKKAAGRLQNLMDATDGGRTLSGACGIGHTRWATHGAPDARNAHPHASPGNRVVIVHNGIIENHRQLRAELEQQGAAFESETDTEAALLLLDSLYAASAMDTPRARALCAIREMMRRLEGSYALGILFSDQPDVLYAAKKDSPLLIGACRDGYMLASDMAALAGAAEEAVFLKDMETACITRETVQLYKLSGEQFERRAEPVHFGAAQAEKGGYAHFMLKEIMEQPRAVRDTLAAYIREETVDLSGTGMSAQRLERVSQVLFAGCGSAYHAGLIGAFVVQQLAGIPARAELASEVRYQEAPLEANTLAVLISQSGETADSLAALRRLRARGMDTLAVVNVRGSAMAREADAVLYTHAGPEVSVATTKAYSAQLAALYLLSAALGKAKGTVKPERLQAFVRGMLDLPERMEEALNTRDTVRRMAGQLASARDVFFIGRGLDHALSMEAALKLKEISYIHAEAYAAGELKHGTISLIEDGVPVVGVLTQAHTAGKTAANMAEAGARGALLLAAAAQGMPADLPEDTVFVPETDELLAASVAIVPLQMLAYEVSCAKGLDVDRPRNLAKSVTVE